MRARRTSFRTAAPPLLALLLIALAACSGGGSAPRPAHSSGAATAGSGTGPAAGPTGTAAGGATTWIIERQALDELAGAGMSRAQLSRLFDNENTYVVSGSAASADSYANAAPDISGWAVRRTVAVTNLSAPHVPAGTSALLYDVEHWSLTPLAQQRDPAPYLAQGRRLTRSRGLVFIATPALDLADVLDPGGSGTADARFLAMDVIADAARNADIVDIQAQSLEGSPRYAQFVTAAARQARAANPDVKVLAGLSTNPSGRTLSPGTFAAEADSVRGVVDGYWLNIPAGGTACPRCGTPQPGVAVPWLDQLLGDGSGTGADGTTG